jgi:hypothetical protein
MGSMLFRLVWWRWLRQYKRLRVVKIVTWRSAWIEALGVPRHRVTFCFWIFD